MVHAICHQCSSGNDGGCAAPGVALLLTIKKAARGSAATRGLTSVVAPGISLRSFARPAEEEGDCGDIQGDPGVRYLAREVLILDAAIGRSFTART